MGNELHKITLKNVSMLALSQKYVKEVPDLAAKAIWFMTNYDIQNGIMN